MVARSAGLLLYRLRRGRVQLLLGHMGGPLWVRRDVGAWTIPKGEYGPGEEPVAAARREFVEELGVPVPEGEPLPLGAVRQSGGKVVTVWALPGELDPASVVPGTFEMEWPRGSGIVAAFPELDRVDWFDPDRAKEKLVTAQRVFVDRVVTAVR